jgi:hypothetical protein
MACFEVHLRVFALRLAGQLLELRLEASLWVVPGRGYRCLLCSYPGLAYGLGLRRCRLAVVSRAMPSLVAAV